MSDAAAADESRGEEPATSDSDPALNLARALFDPSLIDPSVVITSSPPPLPGARPMDPATFLIPDEATLADVPKHFQPDRLFEALNRHGVEYIVIGGLAAVVHGADLSTEDLDLVVERSPLNRDRLAAALRELDGRRVTTLVSDFEPPPPDVDLFYTSAGRLNIRREARAIGGYHDLRPRAHTYALYDHEVYVVDLEALIQDKEAGNRPKDRLQLPALYDLRDELLRRNSPASPTAGDEPRTASASGGEQVGATPQPPGSERKAVTLDDARLLREATRWQLAMTPTQRLQANSQYYRDVFYWAAEHGARTVTARKATARGETS